MKSQNIRLLSLILALGIRSIYGIAQGMPTPTELLECLLFKSMNTSVADVPGKSKIFPVYKSWGFTEKYKYRRSSVSKIPNPAGRSTDNVYEEQAPSLIHMAC